MKLSERGALKAAVCDGGYHIYPAVALVEYIKERLSDEDFKGDFDPVETVAKLRSVKIEADPHLKTVIEEDLNKLCSSLEKLDPNYDIESILAKVETDLPKMAKLYFNIDGYKPVNNEVVEFFFEGYNDIYKDGDWNAFNIDAAESKEYNVPVGIYFKRSQVAPGFPEYVVMHENVHQFTAGTSMDDVTHYYIPWIQEGFADVFGFMMLYKITKNMELMRRTKSLMTEFDVIDSRKSTYHYESAIASQFISAGGLPFAKAFLAVVTKNLNGFDWSLIGKAILDGKKPFDATIEGYLGDKNELKNDLLGFEEEFKKDGVFDEDDLMILRYFASTQPPATLKAPEYRAAVWLTNELNNNTAAHFFNEKLLGDESNTKTTKIADFGMDKWKNLPKGHNFFLVSKDDVPDDIKDAVDTLSNLFFIVKKEYDGKTYYDVFGGGLPYRMGTGELRCSIK